MNIDEKHLELAINSLSQIRDKTTWLVPPKEDEMIELIESIHELAKLTVRRIEVDRNPPVVNIDNLHFGTFDEDLEE